MPSEDPEIATTTTKPVSLLSDDPRVARPLFGVAEAARYLQLPPSTFRHWAMPDRGQPLIAMRKARGQDARVPFIGFAEAYVLACLRRAGVPMQRIRPAVHLLRREIGLDHALASRKLFTDGAEVVYDYAQSHPDEMLTVVRTGQQHFGDVIRQYLQPITYGDDGWATKLRLPTYEQAEVVVDPDRAFGLPFVVHGGARVEDLVDRFKAGDQIADISEDFGVPGPEVEDVLRVALRPAA